MSKKEDVLHLAVNLNMTPHTLEFSRFKLWKFEFGKFELNSNLTNLKLANSNLENLQYIGT